MEALNRIRCRFVWVLLLWVVGLGAGVAYSHATSGGYDATARLFVGTSARDAVEAAQGNIAGQERMNTYAFLAKGSELLERAAHRSNTGVTGADLDRRLTVVALPGTVLLEIRVRDDNPQTAASQADAVATELMDLVHKVEAPIGGGDPALGLIPIQTAQSGVVEAGKFDYKTIAIAGGMGMVLGLVLAGAVPERRPPRRRGPHQAGPSDEPDDYPPRLEFVSGNHNGGHWAKTALPTSGYRG